MKELTFPKLMTVGWSKRILSECMVALQTRANEVLFNLERVEWTAPFGLTALSATLMACLQKGKRCRLRRPKNREADQFLRRIGFDAIFLKDGEKALKKSTSVELRWLDELNVSHISGVAEVMANNLGLDDDDQYHIYMQLLELLTNACDHADSQMGYFICAQAYPTRKSLRFSVADVGRGIPDMLRTIPKYRSIRDDSKLLHIATKAGVTTRKNTAGGMGLNVMRRYLRKNVGTLTLISEYGKVSIRPRETVYSNVEFRFPGTIIDIHMKA